ncbi:hypothetical protein [Nocardia wallacei]|uniref:hypothetical protein n=1 Tax=Nocardia wallacei TaxID=480035 RepID=UPI00245759CD|nr:hypothetical protein [Nocardia wallacei]
MLGLGLARAVTVLAEQRVEDRRVLRLRDQGVRVAGYPAQHCGGDSPRHPVLRR